MSVEDKARYGRACLLVLNTCPVGLRRVIEHHYTTHRFTGFDTFLDQYNNKHLLFHLRFQKCCLVHCTYTNRSTSLRAEQWDLFYSKTLARNPHGDRGKCPCMYTAIPGVTTHVMDVTLCCLLLRNICPGVNISHIGDICAVRNQLLHARSAILNERSFNVAWNKVETALLSLASSLFASFQSELKNTIQETRSGFCDLSNLDSLMAHERRLEYLQQVMETTEKERVKTNERVTILETDVATLESDGTRAAERLTTLESDGTRAAERLTTLEADGARAAERLTTLESDGTRAAERLTTLESDGTRAAERLTTLESDGARAAERLTTLESDGARAAERLTTLESDGGTAADRLTTLESYGATAADRLTTLESVGATAAERLTTLESYGARAADRLTTLESYGATAADRLTTLEEDNTEIKVKLVGIERTICDTRRKDVQIKGCQKEKVLEALMKINIRATEKIQISPLQRTLKNAAFDNIYVPPIIREDLEKESKEQRWSRKPYTSSEQKQSEISSPADLFYKNGDHVRYIFFQGEAGHGKTVFCQNLVRQWCRAKQTRDKKKELSEWERGLNKFDFVFMIMLRHVQKSRTSLLDMICYDLFKHFGSCHDEIRNLIKSGNYRSLFIVDGLDEWKIPPEIRENLVNVALPDIDCTSNSTFLFSYRPWKHAELVGEIQSCDRIIETKGFDEKGKKLAIKNILKTLKLPDSSKEIMEKKSDEIIKMSVKSGLKSILGIPILVPVFVILYHESKFDENSMTSFYISLVQYLIKLANEKKSINYSMPVDIVGKTEMSDSSDGNILVPDILESSKNKTFRSFLTALTKLGNIAYNDLTSSETSLVFSKEELEDTLGSNVLDFALQVGLLNQCQAPGCFDEENVSLNFFHKSIQEFLAATHVVCQGEVTTSTLCRDLSSFKVILDLSEVLKFVSGLSPSLGSVLSRHVVKICEQEHFLELRMNLENSIDLEYLFNLQYRCYLEVRNNQVVEKKYPVNTLHNTEKVTKRKVDIQFHFTVIHFDNSGVSLNEIRDLLDDVNVVTKALYVQPEFLGTENKKLETSLNMFLIRTESLRHLMLDHLLDISLQSLNKDLTLRSVVLSRVRLSCECLHQLVTSVTSSRQLQKLKLEYIEIEQPSTDNSQEEVIYHRKKRKTSIHKQKPDNTSRILVDLWQILPECSDLNTFHFDIKLLKDTFSRDTLLQILPSLKHLRDIGYNGGCRHYFGKEPESESIINTIMQLPQLEKIGMSGLNLSERLIRGMLKLQNLYLENVKVDFKCLSYILQLPDLQKLRLSGIEIPDTDLCINVVLPNLRSLDLCDIHFGDGVLELTSECKNIDYIALFDITMSESGWRRLFTSFPTFHHKVEIMMYDINMSPDSWMTIVTLVLKQDKGVDVHLLKVNIDDESVGMIASCPHVKVTENEMDKEERSMKFITKVQSVKVTTK